MGFDVNFNNKPVIRQAQSTKDGGAGNLGYFEREEGENKEGKTKSNSVFTEQKNDSFQKEGDIVQESQDLSILKIIAQIIMSIKSWIKNTFRTK